ncbi:hypothetical protein [Dyella nitratireducens]|nr:hypothetical protein [Dyella nitratireducens]GLQ44184.1 hypothetical protein GCM10007902_40340 [Dyella nitratireducens]
MDTHTSVNAKAFKAIREAASEISDAGGLRALSLLVDKLENVIGFVTQREPLDEAKSLIQGKLAAIEEKGE